VESPLNAAMTKEMSFGDKDDACEAISGSLGLNQAQAACAYATQSSTFTYGMWCAPFELRRCLRLEARLTRRKS